MKKKTDGFDKKSTNSIIRCVHVEFAYYTRNE